MIRTKKLEDELVKNLANKILFKYKNIYTNRKPSSSYKVRNYLNNQLGYIPILQPEIDMILESYKNELYAIEFKLFITEDINFNLPFYHGLGQAMALYRYGFDKVALFHLFLGEKAQNKLNKYGAEIWSFIRNDLQFPIDYSYIWVENITTDYNFHVMQYVGRQQGNKLLEIDSANFNINFKYDNPIKNKPIQKVIRKCLELWLNGKI